MVGGRAFYARQFPGVKFKQICVTNQFFNDQARMQAKENAVELVEQSQLMNMLAETPVTMTEIEQTMYSN